MPAVAAGREAVEIEGAGLTVICSEADFVMSVTDVAVTVAVIELAPDVGATYVAPAVVWLLKVPPPVTVQVTPAFFESCATIAVIPTVCV